MMNEAAFRKIAIHMLADDSSVILIRGGREIRILNRVNWYFPNIGASCAGDDKAYYHVAISFEHARE
jgi:hypothetical protein